jgi:hypothetical protein
MQEFLVELVLFRRDVSTIGHNGCQVLVTLLRQRSRGLDNGIFEKVYRQRIVTVDLAVQLVQTSGKLPDLGDHAVDALIADHR